MGWPVIHGSTAQSRVLGHSPSILVCILKFMWGQSQALWVTASLLVINGRALLVALCPQHVALYRHLLNRCPDNWALHGGMKSSHVWRVARQRKELLIRTESAQTNTLRKGRLRTFQPSRNRQWPLAAPCPWVLTGYQYKGALALSSVTVLSMSSSQ